MKYFLDQEFIEGFKKPLFGKRRHFIDLISIGMVSEDNRGLYFISSEYKYKDADDWVKENVILKAYTHAVHGDRRNYCDASNFHKGFGITNREIADEIICFVYPQTSRQFGNSEKSEFVSRGKQYGWNEDPNIEFYGYFSDYDWVLFCSLFGRMIDLPKGFPMYCRDLKQMMDEKGVDSNHPDCPKQKNEHIAIHDAMWNKNVYEWLIKL